ncbi:YdcF family protein [Algoriphagus marincola]|uniref:YdcF family protein n=1 Tax=Algoriphagus marincola TaxID=264027 RepID=UPI00040B1CA8|nr:ElyC/SanA/YdcF family protein [Algoriphagus marincola]
MLYLIRKFITRYILSPLNWIYILLILNFFYFNYFLGLLMLLLLPILFNFIPFYLIKKLESQYGNLKKFSGNGFYHIIVLGGGHIPIDSLFPGQQLTDTSLRRVFEGVRLFKENPKALLIMSGEKLKINHYSQAELQHSVASTMGIPPNFIRTLSVPRTTAQEAEEYYDKFGNPDVPIIIVTKALHLRRAIKLFKKENYTILGAPAHFYNIEFSPSISWLIFPNPRLMFVFSEYLKEVFGYLMINLEFLFKSELLKFRISNGSSKKFADILKFFLF